MNSRELSVNIAILEHLGWFIAETEVLSDWDDFDVVLECCRPDWTVLEQVPVTPFLLAFNDVEYGGLEERLWFFAPHYSTSLDNIWQLVERTYGDEHFTGLLGPFNINPLAHDYRYSAEISFHPYTTAYGYIGRGDSPSVALCEAYLKAETKQLESNSAGATSD